MPALPCHLPDKALSSSSNVVVVNSSLQRTSGGCNHNPKSDSLYHTTDSSGCSENCSMTTKVTNTSSPTRRLSRGVSSSSSTGRLNPGASRRISATSVAIEESPKRAERNSASSRLQRAAVVCKQSLTTDPEDSDDSSSSQVSGKSDLSSIHRRRSAVGTKDNKKEEKDDDETNSPRRRIVRRTSYELDSKKSNQRSERRAIASKLRSMKLVSNSSVHSSNHTSLSSNSSQSYLDSSMDDDASCSSIGSSVSSRSSRSSMNRSKSSKTDSATRKKKGSKRRDSVQPAQFAASITSALLSDSDTEDSFSNLSYGASELTCSSMNLNNASMGSLDDENSVNNNSIDILLFDPEEIDIKTPEKPPKRKSKNIAKRRDSLELDDSFSKKNDTLGKLSMSLSDLFERNQSKEKNSKKKSCDQSVTRSVSFSVCGSKAGGGDEGKAKKKGKDRKKLRSCIKGDKKKGYSRQKESSNKEKKLVSFEPLESKLETVHIIKPLLRYAKELYLSQEEIQVLRNQQSDFTNATSEEIKKVQSYVQAYRMGRQQMNYERQMSTEVYQELVIGIRLGYCGIEAHSNLHDSICEHIQETNKSIVAAYKNALLAQNAPRSSGKFAALDASIMVKAHSEALTETDRQWAVAMGKAEMQAAKEK